MKFHDGTDWNAEAFKWNLDQQHAAKAQGTQTWVSTEVIDDYHLQLNVSEYNNMILLYMSLQLGRMVSPTAIKKNGEKWALLHPVGTGPYKFKSFQRDTYCKYERFDGYWGGKPYLDGVEIVYIKDPMTQMAALQAGEAHALWVLDRKLAAELRDKSFTMEMVESFLYTLAPDSSNPDSPFSKKKVREAVECAINRPAIAKATGYGFIKPLCQVSTEDHLGHDPDLACSHPYNPEKAKQLLAE